MGTPEGDTAHTVDFYRSNQRSWSNARNEVATIRNRTEIPNFVGCTRGRN